MPHIHDLYDFTASAYIMHPTEQKICLHYHKKLNSWLQMGGHIELDEDPIMALEHELQEEAGLSPDEYEIIERIDQPKAKKYKYIPLPLTINVHEMSETHKHIDIVFLVRSKTTKLAPQEDESQKIDWFSKSDIEKLHENGEILQGAYDTCLWILEHCS